MSANVRCAGTPIIVQLRETPTEYDELPSCGWKGERYAMGRLTDEQDRTLKPYTDEWMEACLEADAKIRTAKPCPRCGGRVELIPTGGAP